MISKQLARRLIFGDFSLPLRKRFFLTLGSEDCHMDGRPFAHICYQDRGRTAWVRGKFRRGGCGLGRLLLSAALAIYLAEFILAAPRPKAPDDRAMPKVVDEFFASQPGYEKGDLITRSQIEK